MQGAKIFCHLDITDAYTHLPVDEEFSVALTLNIPTYGLIRPTRAVYGAANIPAIWQRRVATILKGLHILNFYDFLVYEDTFDKLLLTLNAVLIRLKQHGLRLNRAKCTFATFSVEFLGHRSDALGVHKSDKHIQAILKALKPNTPQDLELFIGKATLQHIHPRFDYESPSFT